MFIKVWCLIEKNTQKSSLQTWKYGWLSFRFTIVVTSHTYRKLIVWYLCDFTTRVKRKLFIVNQGGQKNYLLSKLVMLFGSRVVLFPWITLLRPFVNSKIKTLYLKCLLPYHMLLDCDWPIPMQLIQNNSAQICYHSAKF